MNYGFFRDPLELAWENHNYLVHHETWKHLLVTILEYILKSPAHALISMGLTAQSEKLLHVSIQDCSY